MLLTVAQAAERLTLKESTLRAWVLRRRIRYVKIGGSVRIPLSVLDEILKNGMVQPVDYEGRVNPRRA